MPLEGKDGLRVDIPVCELDPILRGEHWSSRDRVRCKNCDNSGQ